ncbi:MAG: cytochrome P450 [Gammaproteobacteria bacterium]|jgi:cytochrome P450
MKKPVFENLHHAFDIDDPVFAESFEDVLEHLVAECPVAHSTIGPGYTAFNRYADVRRCAQDWRGFSSADGWMMDPPEGNIHILPEDSDPPYQTTWRRALNPFFTAEACNDLEGFARQYAADLIAKFAARGSCEFVADFAAQLPGLILFKHILPVPIDDLPSLFEDIDIYSFGPLESRAQAFERVYAYLQNFLESRRDGPAQGDLVDVIIAGVERDDQPCPWEDKIHIALDVVFGGLATTTHAMCGAIYELAKQPQIGRDLRDKPERMDTAVEETVRLHAPVVLVGRTVTEDVVVGGTSLKKGERIALNFAAASRDPDVCSDPKRFDIERPEVVHTAFGVGPHRCIGEHLARLEIRVAIEEFLRQIPEFELKSGTSPQFESGQLRTMKQMHLQWPGS